MSKAPRPEAPTFQEIILRLQRYWADNGCVVMQPYDNEVGAGTFHTATTLRSLGLGKIGAGVEVALLVGKVDVLRRAELLEQRAKEGAGAT